MCDHILLMFMATWSDNRLLVELFLPLLPKGVKIRILPKFNEVMRNNFTEYFPNDVIFQIILSRSYFCVDKEVKCKMKITFPFLKKRIYNFIFELIEQYAYIFEINEESELTENMDPIRYEILLNKLKEEKELIFINFQELHDFLNSIRNKEEVVKYEGQVKQSKEVLMPVQELEIFLDTELYEGLFNDMLHEVKDLMIYEEMFITDTEEASVIPNKFGDASRGIS